MKFKNILAASMIASTMTVPTLHADQVKSNVNKQEIEKIIHEYLIAHPEVLLEASQALQQKQQQEMKQKAQAAIEKNSDNLFVDTYTVMGNPKGDVTLVEFFDYQCIHCKKLAPVIAELVKNNDNLRVVYKEFPIFGKSSEFATRAAIAASMQGKYKAMHEALINAPGRLSEEKVLELAKSAGLNMTKLKKDMQSTEVNKAIAANRKLAEEMRLQGTPALVIGATPKGQYKKGSMPNFIPGAASQGALQDMIKKASPAQ